MSDARKTPRIIVPMTDRLIRTIDDWRYVNRVPSRAEAIRRLLETALSTPKMPRRAPK
jgi:metal-responsive CopG/Arc/MetJ family transcriptional regulator